MPKISKERFGEYFKAAIEVLLENEGKFPSGKIVAEVGKRLELTSYEQELNNSGQHRWVTNFRFSTIGLVKAGLIKKGNGFWQLQDIGVDLKKATPMDLLKIAEDGYEEWKKGRGEAPIESGQEIEILDNYKVFTPKLLEMRIEPASINFDDLLKGVDDSTVQIPPFQREFVWSAREILDLLQSIYQGFPIGSFIFWKTTKRLEYHREIGGIKFNNKIPQGALIDFVLDGQQRITSLYAAIRCAIIEDQKRQFFFNLQTGLFESEIIDESDEAEEEDDVATARIPLQKVFTDGASYRRYVRIFPESSQELVDGLFERFHNYKFSVIYVRDDKENERPEGDTEGIQTIVNIFSKINDTGRKLTMVAKMVARCWGENFDLREKLDEFFKKDPQLSEIHEEILIQAASVILNFKKARTRDILYSTNIRQLEREWQNIISAFLHALQFIKDKLRVKNLTFLPFDSLLVPLTYFFYKNHNPSNEQEEQLFIWFWKASLSNRFGSTVEARYEEDCESFDKILTGEVIEFNFAVDWGTLKSRLLAQNYSLRNAFCKTVLCLYAFEQPKNFKDNRDIDLAHNFNRGYKHNLHHFFPRKFLEHSQDPQREQRDSIVNIAFAPAITNIEMSDRAPSDYIKEFGTENPQLSKTLKTHLIDDVGKYGITNDNFAQFLNERVDKIIVEFQKLLGMTNETQQQLSEEPATPIDVFEAKIRSVINQVLTRDFTEDYWEKAIPIDIQNAVEKKVSHDVYAHPYNQEKYTDPQARLMFTDIMDYQKIISGNWKSFENIFGSKAELDKHFMALKNFRNGVKHGHDIDVVVQKNGEAAVLWFEKILNNAENLLN